jgi:hypothetical protein
MGADGRSYKFPGGSVDVGAVAVRALAPVLRVIIRAFTGESDDTAAIRRRAAHPARRPPATAT